MFRHTGKREFFKEYFAPFRWQFLLVIISISIVSSSILGLGYILKFMIDSGFANHNIEGLNKSFILLLFLLLFLSYASYSRSLRINWVCEQLESNIKRAAFKNIISISPSYFDLNKTSDVYSRLTSDLSLINNTIVMIASFSLRNFLMFVGGLVILLFNSPKLTLYVLLVMPIILLPLIYLGRKTKELSKKNQNDIANCNSHLAEALNAIKTIQAYNREKFELDRITILIEQTKKTAYQRIKLRATLFALIIGLILSSVALVIWIGGHDVLAGKMSPGSLSSFVFYAVLVATSLGSLSEVYSDWQRASGALDRVIEVINAEIEIKEKQTPTSLQKLEELSINFSNISFSYPSRPETKVLENVNFEIKSGSTTALVGPSGAGKTTIFQLLLRFYDPNDGEIKLNNENIKNLSLKDLRNQFALVSQEPLIFSGTAYENILYGQTEANKEQVEEAAKAAEILDFFQSLPEGLNTHLGERGIKLSGGQKQRLAIARAIICDPKILLLDEATSSLDSDNERLVQLALKRLSRGRTTIIIAHRISTIVSADKIIILDKGNIAGSGTHQELLKNNLLYQKLSQNYFVQNV